MTSAHAKRWVTALVAIPVLVLLVGIGGPIAFSLLVAAAAAAGLLEYYGLLLSGETGAVKLAGIAVGLALLASFFTGELRIIPVLLVVTFLGSAMLCLATFNPQTSVAEMLFKPISGLIYVPFMLGHLILIRDWDQGVTWTFFLLAVVFAGDTAAFYVGTSVGRHKLAPRVSPGKTVEGAIGGLTANLLVGALFKGCCFPEFGWGEWGVLVVLIGALGQTGDLFESMLKRSVQAKDSGTIMPGHGGLLDRIDALLFAAPGLYYYKTYLM
jgi:phosphatidate cytidylyltransferase